MQSAIERAKPIKLLILDVDGILTNGIIYFDNEGVELKGFHALDGLGLKLLQKAGIKIAIISGKASQAVAKRAADLCIDSKHVFLGHDCKLPAYQQIKQDLQLDENEIAYMGDDLPDLVIMRQIGFAITVPHAPDILQKHAHLITTRQGGSGAVREACEFILNAQDKYEHLVASFSGA